MLVDCSEDVLSDELVEKSGLEEANPVETRDMEDNQLAEKSNLEDERPVEKSALEEVQPSVKYELEDDNDFIHSCSGKLSVLVQNMNARLFNFMFVLVTSGWLFVISSRLIIFVNKHEVLLSFNKFR